MTNARYANTFSINGAIQNAIESAKQFSTSHVVYEDLGTGRFFDSSVTTWRNYQSENENLVFLGKVDAAGNWTPRTSA